MDPAAFATLDKKPYISLVTFKRNGDAVRTPVWFAGCNDKFYVFTEAASWKVKRLGRDDHIRVAPCSVAGKIQGDWCEGRGRVIEDEKTIADAYAALDRKYTWQMRLLNLSSRIFGRIDGRAMLELELD
jgi:PPOX class probable F420-dependent enzyme